MIKTKTRWLSSIWFIVMIANNLISIYFLTAGGQNPLGGPFMMNTKEEIREAI